MCTTAQKVFFGIDSIHNVGDVIHHLGGRNLFLLRGRTSYQSCGAERLLVPQLKGYSVLEWCDFANNPQWEDLLKGLELAKQHKTDVVIAVGGGSVIDMAKMIRFLLDCRTNYDSVLENPTLIKQVSKPLIAIPTTAGTGSEATQFAVLYKEGIKHSVASPLILPDVTIVDPQLTYGLSPYLSACTGFDALAQAIESAWSCKATVESLTFAQASLREIIPHFEDAVLKNNIASRNALSHGAFLSGQAINITTTTVAHALSYPLTSHYGIPHGHAVALLLPKVMEFAFNTQNIKLKPSETLDSYKSKIQTIQKCFNGLDFSKIVDQIRCWISLFGLSLSESKKQQIDVSRVVSEVNLKRLGNFPIELSSDDLYTIVESITR